MDCPMNSTAGEKKTITARRSLSPRFGDSAAPEVLEKPKLEESVEVEVSTKEELDSKDTKLDKDKAWRDDSDMISDDEDGSDMISDDGLHEMNEKEMDEYCKLVNESDGFNVPPFPEVIAYGIIVPVTNLFSNKYVYSEVDKCAEYALEQHNAEVKTNYTLHKIVKANVSGCAGSIYYITFQAEDLDKVGQVRDGDQGAETVGPAGGPIVEFEAKVFLRLPNELRICKMEVMLFRQKGAKVIEKGAKVLEGCCC